MLMIRCPLSRTAEREYIFKVILGEFLGISCSFEFETRSDVEITLPEANGNKLLLADVLFGKKPREWLTAASLPRTPLDSCPVPGLNDLPVIYGIPDERGYFIDPGGPVIRCGLDLFGSCFFMLTRYEELVVPKRDRHDRFPAGQSLACREGFLERPLVNEYTELLWMLMSRLWPGLSRKKRSGRKIISHDVDHPYFARHRSRLNIAKESLADAIKRGEIETALKKARMIVGTGKKRLVQDPFNTFDWLMDLGEREGIRSSFYFIAERTEPGIDGNYALHEPEIRRLLLRIHERGHEIGLHPSYRTYLSPSQLKHQFELLLNEAEAAGIRQTEWGGRQHFLRWRVPDTWQYWEEAGLNYDSTLGYADRPGFRCGVCYEYPVFNLLTRRQLGLRERPLIIMEQTILRKEYGGLQGEEAFAEINRYYEECRKYQGDFTLLWHNSYLVRSADRKIFGRCMNELKNPGEQVNR